MPLNIAEQSDLAALQAQLDDHEARLTALEAMPPADPDPNDPPDPPLPPGQNNIDRIRAAGHPCPPAEDWWVSPPADIQATLVAPGAVTEGVKRIWIPRDIQPGVNVDDSLLTANQTGGGPQQHALYAHYLRAQGLNAAAAAEMAQARAEYRATPYAGAVYTMHSCKAVWSRLLALDWIEWEDAAAYEAAFETLRQEIENVMANNVLHDIDFRETGYVFASHHGTTTPWFARTLLALHAYGVNPAGPSHAWADAQIDKIGAPLSDPDVNWSPWDFSNLMGVVSRRGGGTEWGHGNTSHYGLGSYEEYFLIGAVATLRAVDTACGTTLAVDNLYSRTRHLGAAVETDADSRYSGDVGAMVQTLARFMPGETGQRYAWLANKHNDSPYWRTLQACHGPMPAESPPASGQLVDRLGGHWHYREDASQPDDTFRVVLTCRDVGCFRYEPDERTLRFLIGQVGLSDPRANRGGEQGVAVNGFWFGDLVSGQLIQRPMSRFTYWQSGRAKMPIEIRDNPWFMAGDASGPALNADGNYEWVKDWSGLIGRHNGEQVVVGDGVTGPCSTHYLFEPAARRLTVTDSLSISASLYLGWHFTPTHAPTFTASGFDVSDGSDTVQVTIESLDAGVSLERTERASWPGGIALDWNGRTFPVNIGYTPDSRISRHAVRTVIEAA